MNEDHHDTASSPASNHRVRRNPRPQQEEQEQPQTPPRPPSNVNSNQNNNNDASNRSFGSSVGHTVRRFSRKVARLWTEIMTTETRPALVVNPRHHLRSQSLSSYHTAATGSLDALAEASLIADMHIVDHNNNNNNNNADLTESLLGDSTHSNPLVATEWVVPSPLPPPRRRTTSHGFVLSDDTRRWARGLIRRAGNYLAYTTLLVMLCVVPVVVYNGLKTRHADSAAIRSAVVMAMGTLVLSLRLVYLHLTHWYMPGVQKYVVRILWMVPLYSIQSCLSLRFHESRIYIDTIRDIYEAYVIASFVYYLIELLGGEEALVQILEAKNNNEATRHLGQHAFPMRLILDDWRLGEDFMLNCKHGVLQYVVFKSLDAFITFVCASAGVYGEGKFDWFVAYPYMIFFQNISVMYALYCLVMLFSAVNEELRYPINWRPLGKFLCVKGVVFFTWWQGVVIFYLKAHGIINTAGSWSSREVANGLIDYCVVIEMVGFAIAHSYTFTYKEYLPSNIPPEFRAAHRARAEGEDDDEENSPSNTAPLLAHGTVLNDTDDDNNDNGDTNNMPTTLEQQQQQPLTPMGQRTTAYHPPATLDQPMDFRDAFWSSTVPKETIQDIQKLRASGKFDPAAALRPRIFSKARGSSGELQRVESADIIREQETAAAAVDQACDEATEDVDGEHLDRSESGGLMEEEVYGDSQEAEAETMVLTEGSSEEQLQVERLGLEEEAPVNTDYYGYGDDAPADTDYGYDDDPPPANTDYGYGDDAPPANTDYGYDDDDAPANTDYGYGDPAPDYGYGDAPPNTDYGYGDAPAANTDYGYGDDAPVANADYGYGDDVPTQLPPPQDKRPKRRCSVTRFSIEAEACDTPLDYQWSGGEVNPMDLAPEAPAPVEPTPEPEPDEPEVARSPAPTDEAMLSQAESSTE